MARRFVSWTEQAAADLAAIADYIARSSPQAAARVARKVVDAADSLSELAERGRHVPEPELASLGLRELLPAAYRLIYRVETETVSIITVVHGARDLAALWERERRGEI